jgi:hypothetical protein
MYNWSPRQESNLYLALRRHLFYPLNYGEQNRERHEHGAWPQTQTTAVGVLIPLTTATFLSRPAVARNTFNSNFSLACGVIVDMT